VQCPYLVDKAKFGVGSIETITGASGLYEIRDLSKGPGYRVYFGNEGAKIILLLIGGDKSSQKADIKTAKKLWEQQQQRRLKKKKEEKKVANKKNVKSLKKRR